MGTKGGLTIPFLSKSQLRACFAAKRNNPGSTWDCHEWAHATKNLKKLPERVRRKKARGDMTALKMALDVAALPPKPGPQQVGYAARHHVFDKIGPVHGDLADRLTSTGHPILGSVERMIAAGAPIGARSAANQFANAKLRWATDLLGTDGVSNVMDVVAGFHNNDANVAKTRAAYDAYLKPLVADAKPADRGVLPPGYDTAKTLAAYKAVRSADAATNMVDLDNLIAAHKYNRAEHPLHYLFNPFVSSGPISEIGGRVSRRVMAEVAHKPDASVFKWPLQLATAFGPGNAKRQQEVRERHAKDVNDSASRAAERKRKEEDEIIERRKAEDKEKTVEKKANIDRQKFVAGFLARCVEEGLTAAQIEKRAAALTMVKAADPVTSTLGVAAPAVGAGLGALQQLHTFALLGLPILGGGVLGAGLGQLRNHLDNRNARHAETDNMTLAYRAKALDAALQARANRLERKSKGEFAAL